MNVAQDLAGGPVPQSPPTQAASPQAPEPAGFLAELEWPGDVRDLPRETTWLPLVALAVALGLAVVWWGRRRPLRRVAAPAAPRAEALARLRALVPPGAGEPYEPFYAALKAVLRLHAAERFHVRADVATSEELQRRVAPDASLAACLAACDGVLFARAAPAAEAHVAAHRAGVRWVAGAAEAAT